MNSFETVYELPQNAYGLDINIIYYPDSTTLRIFGSEFNILYHDSALDNLKTVEFNVNNVKKVCHSLKSATDEDDFETSCDGDVIIFRDNNEYHVSSWKELFDIVNKYKLY